MNVPVSDFRAHLRAWLARARAGHDVVVCERGIPVARVVGIGEGTPIERLVLEGVISRPRSADRPVATGRQLPRPSRPVAGRVTDQRR